MGEQLQQVLNAALRKILRPLARLLLRNGIAYGSFSEMAKRVFVEVAFTDFAKPGKKQTVSRVSALTGLTRKEVSRIRDTESDDDHEAAKRYNRAIRVISGWLNDPEYFVEKGIPRILPLNSANASFASLVKTYSGDIPTRAMLDVLVASGCVVKDENDAVRLTRPAYIPSEDPVDKIHILGTDAQELISTIDHNITSPADDLYFQRKVSNTNVSEKTVREFRRLTNEKAQNLLEEFNDWLQNNERDPNDPETNEKARYVSVGIYFYEQEDEQDGS